MFEKKYNLLDEQLAVSGLEMTIAQVFAGISAATSVIGGIFGASQASKSNREAEEAQEKQEELAEEAADLTNKYNKKLDAADKANYFAMRDFSYKTSLQNWQRGAEIQDYNYLSSLKQYEKSITISDEQYDLNARAETEAVEAEEESIQDLFLQQSFQKETLFNELRDTLVDSNLSVRGQGIQLETIKSTRDFGAAGLQNTVNQMLQEGSLQKESALVEGLIAEGRASLVQAGKSRVKAKQSTKASLHRGLMALEAQLSGKRKQAAVQLAQLNTEAKLDKSGVGLNIEGLLNTVDRSEEEYDYNQRVLQANMKSAIDQSERNIKEIALQRDVSDLNVRASEMIMPERISYAPAPELPPERIFVDRMKAIPGYVPPAAQQNVWAPLIQGIGGAAGALSQINWNKPKP